MNSNQCTFLSVTCTTIDLMSLNLSTSKISTNLTCEIFSMVYSAGVPLFITRISSTVNHVWFYQEHFTIEHVQLMHIEYRADQSFQLPNVVVCLITPMNYITSFTPERKCHGVIDSIDWYVCLTEKITKIFWTHHQMWSHSILYDTFFLCWLYNEKYAWYCGSLHRIHKHMIVLHTSFYVGSNICQYHWTFICFDVVSMFNLA